MTAATPLPTAPPPFAKVAQVLWTDLPRTVGGVSPNLGRALNERAGWIDRVPLLSALVVPAAVLLGGLFGAFHWESPGVYSSSWQVTALLLAIACACGAGVGAWLTAGYALGDFLVYDHPYQLADTPVNMIGLRVGLIVSYIGLYLLLVLTPMAASGARRAAAARFDNPGLAIGAHLLVAAGVAFAWSQSVPLMIRPMFVWAPDPTLLKIPPIGAIYPVQSNGFTFAGIAAVASIGMAVVANPGADAWSPPRPVLARTGRAQGFIRGFASGALSTLVFSGLVSSLFDLVVLFGLMEVAAVLRLGVLPLLPRYLREVHKIPIIMRMVVPGVVGIGAGLVLINMVFADNDLLRTRLSFMPVILSLGLGLIVSAFTMPGAPPTTEPAT